ncbi:MAG TPA: leucyl aminopeptidase family protein [Saprospiraceae bacterium]|nr:leucyl aminopeptidase family protein [Saprospiraceae bacterium]
MMQATFEDLLGAVDMLCIPSSKEMIDSLYADVLSLLVPAEMLPPSDELCAAKSSGNILYGQWKGKRIKLLINSDHDRLTEANVYVVAKKLSISAKSEHTGRIGFMLHHLTTPELIQSAMTGWTSGLYNLGLYKNNDENHVSNPPAALYTFLPSTTLHGAANDGITIGSVQQEVMDLVNTPANHQSPALLGEWAMKSATSHGYHTTILDKRQLTHLGMHALLAVNRGSEDPAVMIVTHYKHPEANKKIVLIGKGVIFDTGGVSIKDSKNMHYMKSDMAGAAAALGTVEASARLGLKVDVMAITPVTDNSIGTAALKPGDVISSYAGKSIEVIDTDAEGRLILADALAYAVKEYQPDVMIDMATLTGSIIAAIGPHAAGLFSKNDQLAESLTKAGESSGERLWRMPMFDEYHEDMQSDIADIKNLSDKPYAGSVTAAKFLEFFTSEHPTWAHLDIAGMGFQPNGFGKGYCATAYGVRLLVKWMRGEL